GGDAAEKIVHSITPRAHRILDLRTEGPQEHHVPDDMRPTGVHEHRRQYRDQILTRGYVRRDHRPLLDERVTVHQFKYEDYDVDDDDRERDRGKVRRAARCIA